MQGVKRSKVTDKQMLTKDPTTCEAFCDTWERGLDSYLDAILRRLNIMRDLLNATGSIFVQIGSANVHKMALLLDEVFGHDNAVTTIMFKKSGGTSSSTMPEGSDFLLWYAKDKNHVKHHQLYEPLTRQELVKSKMSYIMLEEPNKNSRLLTPEEKHDTRKIPDGCRLFYRDRLESQGEHSSRREDYVWKGTTYKCSPGRHWSIGITEMDKLAKMNRLISSGGGSLSWKKYEIEIPGKRISNQWASMSRPQTLRYAVQTSELVVERCILMTSDPGDLVLDPTGGSGASAVAAERHGRRWVVIDSSPVAIATMRHYLAAQTYEWYLLQDSKVGVAREKELGGKPLNSRGKFTNDPAFGFVYARCPDVSAGTLTREQAAPPILIVDKPEKLPGVKRVTGPFTVESETISYTLSLVNPDEYEQFSGRIMDALMKNGIDTQSGDECIRVADIMPMPAGRGYTHVGKMGGADVALLIAPEFRAVDNRMIQEASQGARRNNLNTLIAVAFEFQPLADNPPKEFEVRKVVINRALMQKELDKSQIDRALVMIADPRIKVSRESGNLWSVEVDGYNAYDPISGNVLRGESSDVDCWMIDTDYDRESFYARMVHIPNTVPQWAKSQMDAIRTMLGRDLDQDQWNAFTSLKSVPFTSKTGRIAVKIITTTGDEMLKEIDLAKSKTA